MFSTAPHMRMLLKVKKKKKKGTSDGIQQMLRKCALNDSVACVQKVVKLEGLQSRER